MVDSELLLIRGDGCFRAAIVLDRVPDISARNFTKLMKILVFEGYDDNAASRRTLEAWFPRAIQEAGKKWQEKSREFKKEYLDTKLLPRESKAAARVKNDKLYAAVKAAKTTVEKLTARQRIYNDIRAKARCL